MLITCVMTNTFKVKPCVYGNFAHKANTFLSLCWSHLVLKFYEYILAYSIAAKSISHVENTLTDTILIWEIFTLCDFFLVKVQLGSEC